MCHQCLPQPLSDEDFHQWKLALGVLCDVAATVPAPMRPEQSLAEYRLWQADVAQRVRERYSWHLNWEAPGTVEIAFQEAACAAREAAHAPQLVRRVLIEE